MHVLRIHAISDKPFSHAKENSEISTDVRDSDAIVLKFDQFLLKSTQL